MASVGRASFPSGNTGLPSGGVAGRVLTKTTAANYASDWLLASPVGPPVHVANRWYDQRTSAASVQTAGGYSQAANTTVYMPVYISGGLQVTALAVATAAPTNASTQLTLGFSSTRSTGTPGTLLGSASVVAPQVAAVYTVYPTPFTIVQGWYWLSVGANGPVGVDSTSTTGLSWPYSRTGGVTLPASVTVSGFLDSASAAPVSDPASVSNLTNTSLPLIFFYIAATT